MLYRLKSIVARGTLMGAAAALVAASVVPATAVFADSLNPLTDRSLTLSSSAPGWDFKDGSGNSTYAQPNSGANGQKTGNTFAFKVSTDSSANTVKAMTFQYCTTSAGLCTAPGDNVVPGTDTASTSDLNVVAPSAEEVKSADFGTVVDSTSGAVKAVPGFTDPAGSTTGQFAAHAVEGSFVVYYNSGTELAPVWVQSTGWNMAVANVEDGSGTPDPLTGMNNQITLWSTAGQGFTAGQQVKVVFFGTEDNYITNPGSGAFFVKINTYDASTGGTAYDSVGAPGTPAVAPTIDPNDLVDGGVTVANVMNRSIKIQTKVLETMQFSVGTVDPNTLDSATGANPSEYEKAKFANTSGMTGTNKHIPCDPVVGGMVAADGDANVLKLGDQNSESSLSTTETYSTHSYWRLSSNSSAGATVYYSGVTLSNTVGDKITPVGPTKQPVAVGAEQFGLALASSAAAPYTTDYTAGPHNNNADDNGKLAVHASTLTDVGGNASWHMPQLAPLVPTVNYTGTDTATQLVPHYAFDETSNSIPVALATESTEVVDCVTAKMRYIANAAATTPAGIYTTAINYIAAPQY